EREAGRKRFELIFSPGGVFESKAVKFDKVDVSGDKATVRVSGEFTVLAPGTLMPVAVFASDMPTRLVRLAKGTGGWRIWSYETNAFEFAAKLAAAKGDKQRREILSVNADLVSVYLEKALVLEGVRLFKEGQTGPAHEI